MLGLALALKLLLEPVFVRHDSDGGDHQDGADVSVANSISIKLFGANCVLSVPAGRCGEADGAGGCSRLVGRG